MAARRLSDSEKQDLVGRYKAGESTAALAEAFGCSSNTVSRTVKALLPPEAYAALKASRQKGGTVVAVAQPLLEIPLLEIPPLEVAPNSSTDAEPISSDEAQQLMPHQRKTTIQSLLLESSLRKNPAPLRLMMPPILPRSRMIKAQVWSSLSLWTCSRSWYR
jgi:hypothetical protein